MIFNWLRGASEETIEAHESLFVARIERRREWRRVDAFVVVSWALIVGKCLLASLAIEHWSIPIHDLYVWVPSVVFGGLCTWFYLRGEAA